MSTSAERMRALRARRAAGLVPVEGPCPLPEADRLLPAVDEAVQALKLSGQDAGAVQIARQYARVIDQAADQAWALRWLAPELLKVLAALGATPAARAGLKPQGAPQRPGPNRVAQLRGCARGHAGEAAARGWPVTRRPG